MNTIVCYGVPRSGSTYAYNLVRLSLVLRGFRVDLSYFAPDGSLHVVRRMPGSEWRLIKTHTSVPQSRELLIATRRNLLGAAASWKRASGMSGNSLVDWYAAHAARHDELHAGSRSLAPVDYECLCRNPGHWLALIEQALGLAQDVDLRNWAIHCANNLQLVGGDADGQLPASLMHAGHHGVRRAPVSILTGDERHALMIRGRDYQRKWGYA